MVLDKLIRERLHDGQAEFLWPGRTEPQAGWQYPVENTRGIILARIRVVRAVSLGPSSWQVTAVLVHDQVRLLAKVGGYTETDFRALRNGHETEAEAVDEATQEAQTARARAGRAVQAQGLLDGIAEVERVLVGSVESHPQAKLVKRELWAIRGRLNAAKARLQRSGAG